MSEFSSRDPPRPSFWPLLFRSLKSVRLKEALNPQSTIFSMRKRSMLKLFLRKLADLMQHTDDKHVTHIVILRSSATVEKTTNSKLHQGRPRISGTNESSPCLADERIKHPDRYWWDFSRRELIVEIGRLAKELQQLPTIKLRQSYISMRRLADYHKRRDWIFPLIRYFS